MKIYAKKFKEKFGPMPDTKFHTACEWGNHFRFIPFSCCIFVHILENCVSFPQTKCNGISSNNEKNAVKILPSMITNETSNKN